MSTKKFRALAYIGVFELSPLGDFDTAEEAQEALRDYLEKQLEGEPEESHDSIEEAFWFDSNIIQVEA